MYKNKTEAISLLKNVREFRTSPQLEGFSRVTLMLEDDSEVTAGADTGRELRLFCPWGTQQMAENILASVKGYSYQPYEAPGAYLDPAVELMDGVTIEQTYGGIYSMSTELGPDYIADLESPEDQELEHQYPYQSPKERRIHRRFKHQAAELRVNAQAIAAEVQARTEEGKNLRATLAVQAEQISAKVEKTGGQSESFRWELVSDHNAWYANGSEIAFLSKAGLRITGEIRAKSGTIGGFVIERDHLSYNNQTWGGTNSRGGYLGASGLQMGSVNHGFRVDMNGHMTCESGEFRGSVRAGSILYGGADGYMSGAALHSRSVSGGAISYGTITTANTGGGINRSLGYANFANDVFSEIQTCQGIRTNALAVFNTYLYVGGHYGQWKSMTVNGKKINYFGYDS